MIDLFRQLKIEYKEYLILFKCGSFYIAFDEDATILNNIFNYNIIELKNNIKVGFPLKLIDNNLRILEENKIYYLVVNDKMIVDKYNKGKNKYYKYISSVFDIVSLNNRLNLINKKIRLINEEDIRNKILLEIEKILK